jgi:hypothetical protein
MSSGRTSSRFTIILIAFFVVVVMDWVTSYLNLPLFSFLFPFHFSRAKQGAL